MAGVCLGPQDDTFPAKNDQLTKNGTNSTGTLGHPAEPLLRNQSSDSVCDFPAGTASIGTCFCHRELDSFLKLFFPRLF